MHEHPMTSLVHEIWRMAAQEARELHHDHVGTEHLLLSLVSQAHGVTGEVLRNLGVNRDTVKEQIGHLVDPGYAGNAGWHIKRSALLGGVFKHAWHECQADHHAHIRTRDLLLGMLHEDNGTGTQILYNLGVSLPRVRGEINKVIAGHKSQSPTGEPAECVDVNQSGEW
ncbi:MAG: Clp protease N-terminal domain-containing protein [Gemmataceae bacterium]